MVMNENRMNTALYFGIHDNGFASMVTNVISRYGSTIATIRKMIFDASLLFIVLLID